MQEGAHMIIRRSIFAFLMLVTMAFIIANGLFVEYDEQPLYMQQAATADQVATANQATDAHATAAPATAIISAVPTVTPTPPPLSTKAQSQVTPRPAATVTPKPTATPSPTWDEWSYTSSDMTIQVEEVEQDGLLFFVADVRITDPSTAGIQLKSAFANDRYGKNIRETASAMADRKGAILAVNADYYGFHSNGVLIREGQLYRNKPYDVDLLVVGADGTLYDMKDKDAQADGLLAEGVRNTFSFGPTLVRDGEAVPTKSKSRNPRTAIGMVEPGHYVLIVVDGRSNASKGMTLTELTQLFIDRGASFAYNLDGGGSSTMVFMGRVLNHPSDDLGERRTSDILYFLDLPHAELAP